MTVEHMAALFRCPGCLTYMIRDGLGHDVSDWPTPAEYHLPCRRCGRVVGLVRAALYPEHEIPDMAHWVMLGDIRAGGDGPVRETAR